MGFALAAGGGGQGGAIGGGVGAAGMGSAAVGGGAPAAIAQIGRGQDRTTRPAMERLERAAQVGMPAASGGTD